MMDLQIAAAWAEVLGLGLKLHGLNSEIGCLLYVNRGNKC